MKVFFIYNPHTKKWERKEYLNNKHVTVCIGDMVFCPIHKQFEKVIHYSQFTESSNFTRTTSCLFQSDCYVLFNKTLTYRDKMNNIDTLEELLLRTSGKLLYAYEIIEEEKLYLKEYYVKYELKNEELIMKLSEEKNKIYKDFFKQESTECFHYLSTRLRKDKLDREKKNSSYKNNSFFLHKHLTNQKKRINSQNKYEESKLAISILCDEVIDYIILLEIVRGKTNHKYNFGSTSIHNYNRYHIWEKYTDIDYSLIRDKLSLIQNYNFYEATNYDNFSILSKMFEVKENLYSIYKKNPLEFLKTVVLLKIGFNRFEAGWIIEKLKNKNFLGEFEYKIYFSPLEEYGMKFSNDNFFPEFLQWLYKNGYKEFAKNICIAQSNEYNYNYKGRYILWKILEITNNLPVLEEGLSVQKFINRAYIGFDAISHVFALDFILDKRYKDGKLGEYSYTELLIFQDILKVSKIVGVKPSYRGFLSCILNKDRYIMIRKENKVVGLLLASIGGFKVKSLEEIPLNSLEGWKEVNCYYEDKLNYVRIPEVFYYTGRVNSKKVKLDDLYIK